MLGFGGAQGAMWTHVLLGGTVASIAILQLMSSRKSSATVSAKSVGSR